MMKTPPWLHEVPSRFFHAACAKIHPCTTCAGRTHALASTLAMCLIKSTTRQEYPHSLSYQHTTFTKVGSSMMPALESKVHEMGHVSKSVDTRASSV
eukprot:4265795-Amphidinium_carterae.1